LESFNGVFTVMVNSRGEAFRRSIHPSIHPSIV
jgi:hypothetical protein